MADKDKDKNSVQENTVQDQTVEMNGASDTADNNHSLNNTNTAKGLTGKHICHTTISGKSYPTYRLETNKVDGKTLAIGDKVSFTATGRKHTGEVKALTGNNKLDVVFCDVQIT